MVKRLVLPLLLALPASAPALNAPTGGGVIGSDAPACTAGGGPAVLVRITGLKDRKGDLKLELYPPNEQDFLKDDRDLVKEGKLFRRIRVATPPAGPVAICMRVPAPGRYALLFTHNRDGKNKFSVWSDGAGFVGTGNLGRSRPRLAQALIDVPAGVKTVTMRAQYLRGLAGFAPAGGD